MLWLNHAFAAGRPSQELASAGVVARLFDPSEKPDEPWLPCPGGSSIWCRVYGDRMPCSIINAQAPHLYAKGDSKQGGFLLQPAVHNQSRTHSAQIVARPVATHH